MDSDDSEIDYSPATLHPDIKVKNDFNGEIPVDFIGKAESNFVGEDRKVVEHAPAGSELIPESEGDTWSEYLEWPLDEKTRPDELKFSDYLDYVPLPHSEQSTKLADLKKMTFICEMCDVNISSKADLKVHCDGFMHRMASLECRELMKAGHLLEPLLIRQVPNPKPVKHKIPVRLQAKIREIPKPVIGLQCIEEFMPHYDPEAEPYYECFLCGSRGEANCMFSHVTSGSHQRKVLQAKYPNDLKFIDPPRKLMEAEVLRLAENDNLDLILTYRSDLMFPWSTDKAPWSRAQGGSGVVPSAARAKIKFEVDVEQGKEELLSKHPMWVALFKKRERALQALTGCVPSSKSIPEVCDWKDLQQHALFLQRLMDRIGDVRLACGLKTNLDYLAKFETARLAVKSAALGVAMLADENPNN